MKPDSTISQEIKQRIDERGIDKTAQSLRLSRLSTAKLAAGLNVTWGVIVAAKLALSKEERGQ
jgi:hypothetical protein